jgi:rhodanese-related sulfurtransferase
LDRKRKVTMGWTVLVVLGVVLFAGAFVRYRMGPRGLEMSVPQLLERLGQADCVVLDVRSAREYRSGHIPGALHISHGRFGARLDELKPHKDRDIVVYCEAGIRSRIAQNTLTKAGFTKAYRLIGDMAAWRRENHTVESVAAP